MLPGAGGRGEDSNKAGYYLCKSTRVAEPAGKTDRLCGSEHRAGQTHCGRVLSISSVSAGAAESVGGLFRMRDFIHCVRSDVREKVVMKWSGPVSPAFSHSFVLPAQIWPERLQVCVSRLKLQQLKDKFSAFGFCA